MALVAVQVAYSAMKKNLNWGLKGLKKLQLYECLPYESPP
jgi:hypothetical protein